MSYLDLELLCYRFVKVLLKNYLDLAFVNYFLVKERLKNRFDLESLMNFLVPVYFVNLNQIVSLKLVNRWLLVCQLAY